MSDAQQVRYYPAFDYLRIVLATVVAAGHANLISWEQSGNYSVQVFFALSGWLIGGILLRSKIADLPQFYFNRAARIWIPYFVAIGLLVAASLLKDHVTAKWLEIFFYDSTFVYNFFGPPQLAVYRDAMPLQGTGNGFWSISAEEQFYFLAPFLITILPAKIGKKIWFWSFLSTVALSSLYWSHFGSISLGVLAAILRGRFGDWHSWRSSRLALGVIAIIGFAATCMDLVAYRVGAPISSICIVLFLAQAGRHSRVASFVGGVSYPMYLNHWIGVFIANAVFAQFSLRGTWLSNLSGVFFALVVATALYVIVDRNVRKNREQFFTVFRGKAVAGTGFVLVAIGFLGGIGLKSHHEELSLLLGLAGIGLTGVGLTLLIVRKPGRRKAQAGAAA
jgi:peptidoglycan/LPS O-acetylase OafA/YrhL